MADTDTPRNNVRRREALAKLGLGALVVYAAPTVVHLDRTANAQVRPSCNGKTKGNPWCKRKGKGKSKSGKRRTSGKRRNNDRNSNSRTRREQERRRPDANNRRR